jgi:hypothetical protein
LFENHHALLSSRLFNMTDTPVSPFMAGAPPQFTSTDYASTQAVMSPSGSIAYSESSQQLSSAAFPFSGYPSQNSYQSDQQRWYSHASAFTINGNLQSPAFVDTSLPITTTSYHQQEQQQQQQQQQPTNLNGWPPTDFAR